MHSAHQGPGHLADLEIPGPLDEVHRAYEDFVELLVTEKLPAERSDAAGPGLRFCLSPAGGKSSKLTRRMKPGS